MVDKKLEDRTKPCIIIQGTKEQLNDPKYMELIKYCIEDIKQYNEARR